MTKLSITSALTGAGWVHELLNSHPEHICNEHGVYKHVFLGLVTALEQHGVTFLRHVYIKEQLAIF